MNVNLWRFNLKNVHTVHSICKHIARMSAHAVDTRDERELFHFARLFLLVGVGDFCNFKLIKNSSKRITAQRNIQIDSRHENKMWKKRNRQNENYLKCWCWRRDMPAVTYYIRLTQRPTIHRYCCNKLRLARARALARSLNEKQQNFEHDKKDTFKLDINISQVNFT